MKKSIYLYIYLSICLSVSLNGQSTNSQDVEKGKSIQRNATYNLEEIKVRWKKAALENCTGVPCVPPVCPTSTVTDVDGNIYNTVAIGTQCWTKENLRVTKYDDGSTIPLDNTGSTSGTSGTWAVTTGAMSVYANNTSNVSDYGYLYNWYAATDSRKICPLGWHVPTDAEWTTLETYLNTVAPTGSVGGKMKSISSLWNSPNTGADDSSGFSALPGGFRNFTGSFSNVRSTAFFWSATVYGSNYAWHRYLLYNDGNVYRDINIFKSVGASVRCLRD
jgi:uncharacterized protein (TIGR02145 family)